MRTILIIFLIINFITIAITKSENQYNCFNPIEEGSNVIGWNNLDKICDNNYQTSGESIQNINNIIQMSFKASIDDKKNVLSSILFTIYMKDYEGNLKCELAQNLNRSKSWNLIKQNAYDINMEMFLLQVDDQLSILDLNEAISIRCYSSNPQTPLKVVEALMFVLLNKDNEIAKSDTSVSKKLYCLNNIPYGYYYFSPNTPKNYYIITSYCSYAGEYSTFYYFRIGMKIEFFSDYGDDITIRAGSYNGPVIATGSSPLSLVSTYEGTVYVHWNTPGCGYSNSCRYTGFVLRSYGPCDFAPYTRISATELKTCLDSIPLKEETRVNTLKQYRLMLEFYPFTDILLKEEGIDIENELKNIETFPYTNEFSFHYDLFKLTKRLPDSHMSYNIPDKYSIFYKLEPYIMIPHGSSNIIKTNYASGLYFNVMGSQSKYGRVNNINSLSVKNYFITNSNIFSKDDALRFNNYYNQQMYSLPFYYYSEIFRDFDSYSFSDGQVQNLEKFYFSVSYFSNFRSNRESSSNFSVNNYELPSLPKINKETIKLTKKSEKKTEKRIFQLGYSFGIEWGIFTKFEDFSYVPFLKIFNFPSDSYNFENIVLDFVNYLSTSNSSLAIIDINDNNGGDITLTEWTINILTRNYPKIGDIKLGTKSYNLPVDFRIDSYRSKYNFNLNSKYFIDAQNGKDIDAICEIKDPIITKRSTDYTQLSSLLLYKKEIQLIELPPFNTFYHIITNGECASSCSHFVTGMRSTNLAKIFGVGGLTDINELESSHAYGINSVSWNSFVYLFQRSQMSPIEGDINFGFIEAYEFSNDDNKRREFSDSIIYNEQNENEEEQNEQDEQEETTHKPPSNKLHTQINNDHNKHNNDHSNNDSHNKHNQPNSYNPTDNYNEPHNQHTQTPNDHTEPPNDHTDPPNDHTDPPNDHTDPPNDHTEPPNDHTDPPNDHTDPPNYHNSYYIPKQYSSKKLVDQIIGWDEYDNNILNRDIETLYNIVSLKDSRTSNQKLQRYNPIKRDRNC